MSSVNSWLAKKHVLFRKCEMFHRKLFILLPSRGSRPQWIQTLIGICEPFAQAYVLAPQVRKLSGFSFPLVEEHKEFGMGFTER